MRILILRIYIGRINRHDCVLHALIDELELKVTPDCLRQLARIYHKKALQFDDVSRLEQVLGVAIFLFSASLSMLRIGVKGEGTHRNLVKSRRTQVVLVFHNSHCYRFKSKALGHACVSRATSLYNVVYKTVCALHDEYASNEYDEITIVEEARQGISRSLQGAGNTIYARNNRHARPFQFNPMQFMSGPNGSAVFKGSGALVGLRTWVQSQGRTDPHIEIRRVERSVIESEFADVDTVDIQTHQFMAFSDVKSFVDYADSISEDPNITLHEILQEDSPVRMFIDIEWYQRDYDDLAGRGAMVLILCAVKKVIEDLLGDDITIHDPYVVSNNRISEFQHKYSFHCYFTDVTFPSRAELYSFIKYLKYTLQQQTRTYPLLGRIDWGVYNRNHTFRYIRSKKDNVPFIFLNPLNPILTQKDNTHPLYYVEMAKFMMGVYMRPIEGHVIDSNLIPRSFQTGIGAENKSPSLVGVSSNNMPHLTSGVIIDVLNKLGDYRSSVQEIDHNVFRVNCEDGLRPCPFGNIHRSNGATIEYKEEGVMYTCFSQQACGGQTVKVADVSIRNGRYRDIMMGVVLPASKLEVMEACSHINTELVLDTIASKYKLNVHVWNGTNLIHAPKPRQDLIPIHVTMIESGDLRGMFTLREDTPALQVTQEPFHIKCESSKAIDKDAFSMKRIISADLETYSLEDCVFKVYAAGWAYTTPEGREKYASMLIDGSSITYSNIIPKCVEQWCLIADSFDKPRYEYASWLSYVFGIFGVPTHREEYEDDDGTEIVVDGYNEDAGIGFILNDDSDVLQEFLAQEETCGLLSVRKTDEPLYVKKKTYAYLQAHNLHRDLTEEEFCEQMRLIADREPTEPKKKDESTIVYCWNGSRFDFVFMVRSLMETFGEAGVSDVVESNGKIIMFRFKKLLFMDACLMIPMSLRRAAKSFGLTIKKGHFPHLYFQHLEDEKTFFQRLGFQGTWGELEEYMSWYDDVKGKVSYNGDTTDNPLQTYFDGLDEKDFIKLCSNTWEWLEQNRDKACNLEQQMLDYLKADVLVQLRVVDKFGSYVFEQFGQNIKLCPTIGNLAVKIWKRHYLCEDIPKIMNASQYDFLSNVCNHGGFTSVLEYFRFNVTDKPHLKIYKVDVTSLYPASCLETPELKGYFHGFPYPRNGLLLKHTRSTPARIDQDLMAMLWGLTGFVTVTYRQLEGFPVLLQRVSHNNHETYTFLREGEGTFSIPYIKFAFDHGVEMEMTELLYSNTSCSPLAEYMTELMALKNQGDELRKQESTRLEGERIRTVTKLALNALIGRLNMHIERDSTIFTTNVEDVISYVMNDFHYSDQRVNFIEKKGDEDGRTGFFDLRFKEGVFRDRAKSSETAPEISAYVLFYSKIIMQQSFQFLHRCHDTHLLYTDTDSIIFAAPEDVWKAYSERFVPQEKTLGMMDFEGAYEEFVSIGPKKYGLRKGGMFEYKANGIKSDHNRDVDVEELMHALVDDETLVTKVKHWSMKKYKWDMSHVDNEKIVRMLCLKGRKVGDKHEWFLNRQQFENSVENIRPVIEADVEQYLIE